MSQFDFGNLESPLSGEELVNDNLEPWRDAILSLHSGSSRPSYAVAGTLWLDTSATPWVLYCFDGTNDISLGTINATTNVYTPAGLSVSAYIQTLLDDADAATAQSTLGLVIGANVQAYNANLAAEAGLTGAADRVSYYTGVGTKALATLTSAGRNLIDDTDAAAQRTTLGLGTAATANTGTSAGNVVVLDGSAKLPAVDGSQLTNLPSAGGSFASGSLSGSSVQTISTAVTSSINRIIVSLYGVNYIGLRLGDSGGVESSGYAGGYDEGSGEVDISTAFIVNNSSNTDITTFELHRIGTTNGWNCRWSHFKDASPNLTLFGIGYKATSAATDRVAIVNSGTMSGTYSISLLEV